MVIDFVNHNELGNLCNSAFCPNATFFRADNLRPLKAFAFCCLAVEPAVPAPTSSWRRCAFFRAAQ
jgi:hypothetical protein